MASTDFTNDVTVIDASWLNDIDAFTYEGTPGSGFALLNLSGAAQGQIKFPATANPSSNANTLDDYQEGTTTFTLTGCTTTPTYVGKWTKIGNKITLSFPGTSIVTGTSNTTAKTLTGLDAELRPSGDIYAWGAASDNGGGSVIAALKIDSSGVISLCTNAAGSLTWTGSGTMQFILPMMSWTVA